MVETTQNIAVDASTLEVLAKVQDTLEPQFGFRLTLAQAVHLAAKSYSEAIAGAIMRGQAKPILEFGPHDPAADKGINIFGTQQQDRQRLSA